MAAPRWIDFLKRARCTAFLRLPMWPPCQHCPPKDRVRRAASRCSSPAWSICSGRRSASPRSSCWRRPAARSRCRARRPAAASRPTIPATAPTPRRSPRQVIEAFAGYDYVVAPSGLLRRHAARMHYPELFADEPAMQARAEDLAGAQPTSWWRSWSMCCGVTRGRGALRRRRHLSRRLLGPARARRQGSSRARCSARSRASRLQRIARTREVCCGFGGTFCVKYPEISDTDGRRQGRPTSPRPAPTRCWPAISAAC